MAVVTAVVLLGTAAGGCKAPPLGGQDTTGPKVLDRLVAAYPEDLGATRRFQVIADFEDPRQASLFRREPDGDAEAVGISTLRAQQETGVGALRISLLNATQQIVAADSPGASWGLHQDWAPYNLLLFSVFSPRDQGGLRFSIRSGMNRPLLYEHPRIFLKAGWNRIRVDLADVAEQVYLGDIREVRFWCDPLDSPVELFLDDIILADNSRELMAGKDHAPGELSVKAAGRRLVVTSAERFELVFSRGRIRQWFDLASDRQRMHNLTGGGCMGPTPVLIGKDGSVQVDQPSQWARLGPLAESYQTLVEASPLRVVIHGEWRFGKPDSPFDENAPYHRWVYSIYRGGEVYFECSGLIRGADATEVGMVVGCDGSAGFQRTIQQPQASTGRTEQVSCVLFSQPPEVGSADLLVVPSRGPAAQVLENPSDPRLCVLYRVPVEADQFVFTGLMRVWPSDIDSLTQAAPMAMAYARPLPISVDT
ncbi:MAG: hypothetical protein HY718_14650, partial [Planctomycetes bacterium]|nr:hypothetical protein [Planctomycetota bacterium]